MSNLEEQANGKARYYGVQTGIVVDNADPLGQHRVKILVPGIADPSTDWAYPLTAGGGSPQRGGHVAPAVGAEVALWFKQGDPHADTFYLCGWWGVQGASGTAPGPEVPDDLKAVGTDAHLVQSLQIGKLSISFDERDGRQKLLFRDANSGDYLVWDLTKQSIQVSLSSSLLVKVLGTIQLDAAVISLNKRVVIASRRAI